MSVNNKCAKVFEKYQEIYSDEFHIYGEILKMGDVERSCIIIKDFHENVIRKIITDYELPFIDIILDGMIQELNNYKEVE